MRQSNTYIVLFALGLTLIMGTLLTLAAVGLKPQQEAARKRDTQKQILKTVIALKDSDDIHKLYESKISSIVVNSKGEVVDKDAEGNPVIAETVNLEKNYKLDPSKKMLPVYIYDENADKVPDAYIFAVYGNGLWDKIWGWIALEPDFNTVKGIVMDHKGETPGLGARITSDKIQHRYIGKKVQEGGEIVGITMIKGEGNDPAKIGDHEVDGMSGATLTANGVNSMIESYLSYYKSYMLNTKKKAGVAVN